MITFKITKKFLEEIKGDLDRPHPYAAERVGFLIAKSTQLSDGTTILLASGYHPVSDSHYVDDPSSGARINAAAIMNAMQIAFDTGDSIFHIHPHFFGTKPPIFSRMDREEIPRIVKSLQAAQPQVAHGMLVANREHISGLVLDANSHSFKPINKFVVVGYPMRISII